MSSSGAREAWTPHAFETEIAVHQRTMFRFAGRGW